MYKMNTITPTANHIFHGFGINFQQSLANGSVSFQVRTTMGCSSDVVKSYCILWLSSES